MNYGIFATPADLCGDFIQKWLLSPYAYNVISAERESMLKTLRINFDRHEARRDRRYTLPPVTVTLGSGAYATSNWSLGGLLLPPGIDLALGASVGGNLTLPDGSATHVFTAEVVRCDADGIGLRFAEPSEELVGALDRAIANRLFRKRA